VPQPCQFASCFPPLCVLFLFSLTSPASFKRLTRSHYSHTHTHTLSLPFSPSPLLFPFGSEEQNLELACRPSAYVINWSPPRGSGVFLSDAPLIPLQVLRSTLFIFIPSDSLTFCSMPAKGLPWEQQCLRFHAACQARTIQLCRLVVIVPYGR